MLQQHGMADEQLRAFEAALRIAFGARTAQVVAPVAVSPFAVTAEAGAGREAAAGAATGSLFTAGGSFPSQGTSAFGNSSQGPTPEELAQSRADALTSLKQRVEVQRLKHGAATTRLATAQEAAKKAVEAGTGGQAEAEQAATAAEKEVQAEQDLIEALEAQRTELESEAFCKIAGGRPARSSPF